MTLRHKLSIAVTVLLALSSAGALGEWRYYAKIQPDRVLFLGEDASAVPGCLGQRVATEQKFALGQFVNLRDLCYELDKAGDVRLTDPAKYVLKTFTIGASHFVRIQTEEERRAVAIERIQQQMTEGIRDMDVRRQELERRDHLPITCTTMGSITTCD